MPFDDSSVSECHFCILRSFSDLIIWDLVDLGFSILCSVVK